MRRHGNSSLLGLYTIGIAALFYAVMILLAQLLSRLMRSKPHERGLDQLMLIYTNIGFIEPRKLGQLTGAKAGRQPVAKVNEDGEVVAIYPSARKAAKANHMSYQAVIDRCHGKIKKPFALDGHTYRYEK